ncbi:hypothetical protein [Rhodococcus globerulus]|uniref:hypothetical protein n=1 Tax=Rhodococcus globerulus TaxID=33008 RepID=UPI0030192C8A
MNELPHQQEFGVQLAVEDGFQIEFKIRGTREGGRIAKQSELAPVADNRPQVLVAAIEEFLHHRLRRTGCATYSSIASVQVNARTEQMHRHMPPQM